MWEISIKKIVIDYGFCSLIHLSLALKQRSLGEKIPVLHGRLWSKTRARADLESLWASWTHTLYAFSSWFCKLNINFLSCYLRSWCLAISLKKWQLLMGLQGHVFKAQHIHQSSSVRGSNPTSQREGKKGIFWYSLQGLFSFQKLFGIWFIIFPLGFLARLRNCPCRTADTIFTVAMPWWLSRSFDCPPRTPSNRNMFREENSP